MNLFLRVAATLVTCTPCLAVATPDPATPQAPTEAVSPDDEGNAVLDAQVRRIILELLTARQQPVEAPAEPAAVSSDADLRTRIARILRELLEEGERPKPVVTEEGAAVEPTRLAAEAGTPLQPQVAEAEEPEHGPKELQERARTVYDEGAQLVQDRDRLTFGGFVQMTFDNFLEDHPTQAEYKIARSRLDIRGAAAEGFSYRIFWDIGRSGARLEDAWLEYTAVLFARGRIGQLKVPFSLEGLSSPRWIRFSERSLGPLNLAPGRDVGFNLFGRVFGDRLEYALGIFDGPDAKGDANAGTEKAIRLSWQTTRFLGLPVSQGVHMGVSFTHRAVKGSIAGLEYKTSARTPFFVFADGVQHDGDQYRLGVEAEWIRGSWYVASEYMRLRRQGLELGDARATIDSEALYVKGSWILTGEEQTRNRPIVPRRRADREAGTWGAFDFHARFAYLGTDSEALDLGLATGTDGARSATAGFNWWPRTNLRTVLELEYTDFDRPIVLGEDTIDHEWVVKVLTQFEF